MSLRKILYLLVSLCFFSCEKNEFKWNLDRNNFNDTLNSNYGAYIPNENSPQVKTLSSQNLTQNSFTISGEITNLGSSQVTNYGHCWSIEMFPAISDDHTNLGVTENLVSFESNLSGLIPSTKYYVRSFATNSFGTSYGNQISVQTSDPIAFLSTTNSCNSLTGVNSSFEHWHYDIWDAHTWSTSSFGYNGNCFFAPDNGGNGPIGGYLEFPIVINNYGYVTFWIRSGASGTWYGANRIPVLYVDGVEVASPSVISGASQYDWQQFKTPLINQGNHVLKVFWSNISNTAINYKVDEIETWEY